MLSEQGSRLTQSRLIDCVPEPRACVGLLPGQGREYSLVVIRQGAIAPLQRLPKLKPGLQLRSAEISVLISAASYIC